MPYAYCTEVLILFKAISRVSISRVLESILAGVAALQSPMSKRFKPESYKNIYYSTEVKNLTLT